MNRVRLGAVGYLNARPLVYGLDRSPRFAVRFDVPARCADILHENAIDVGLIPSIEYLRGDYRIVPDVAIASRGPVASVALYATRPMADVRSIAIDTSSRTSVALVRVLCARAFGVRPVLEASSPDLTTMLARSDAALIIGDNALFSAPRHVTLGRRESAADGDRSTADQWQVPDGRDAGAVRPASSAGPPVSTVNGQQPLVEKIDLGEVWTRMTGLPFVYAFWAGRPGALTAADVGMLQAARDAGVGRADEIAGEYFSGAPERRAIGARYLRENVKYDLGPDERAGLELFYRYATETGIVPETRELSFF